MGRVLGSHMALVQIFSAHPDMPPSVANRYATGLASAIADGEEIHDIQVRSPEEGHLLEYLLAEARDGHQNLLPLTESSLKVSNLKLLHDKAIALY